jgi:NADH dehydrogenase
MPTLFARSLQSWTQVLWMTGVVFAFLVVAALAIARAGRRMVLAPTVAEPRAGQGKRPRVVILGGGFAGVYTARYLERALRKKQDFDVILINQENYFVFQPMLPEVISGTIGLVDTVSPLRRLLARTEVHVRSIESVDLERKVVITSPGFQPHTHEIPFDHLVIALGRVTDFRGMKGLPEHALPFKNLADALALRSHVIRALEEAAIERHDPSLRRELLTFVIAGGGYSGVEIAAELNDFVRSVASAYRSIDSREIRVVLLQSRERILPEVSEKLARFAHRILERRGVEIRLHARLLAASGSAAILVGGERLPTRTLVSTVPSWPHPVVDAFALPKARGGVLQVDRHLRAGGRPDIWALGDCAQVIAPDGSVSPPTAQHATRQARTAARNIIAAIRGGAAQPFDYRGLGTMGSLGHRSAVAQILGFQVSGFLAWFIWRTVYLAKLPGWGRRLKVATSWTLDLFLPPDLVELRVSRSTGMIQEHFAPGEAVFHQGDLGDRLYIILAGDAVVVRENAGAETVIAQLAPGEYFGELALLYQKSRNATVRALSPLDTLSLPKRDFGMLIAHLPLLRDRIEALARRRRPSTHADAEHPLHE